MNNIDRGMVTWAENERSKVLTKSSELSTDLPLNFLRQQAHYTTPASNYKLANSAASQGLAPSKKMFAKYDIKPEDIVSTFGVPLPIVEEIYHNSDPHAPLVMIDGEDAQALDEEVVVAGRKHAVEIFRDADWGPTLRFYRPSGLHLPYCVEDLITVLTQVGEAKSPEDYPIDGVIFPKFEHPDEVSWVCNTLEQIETRLGLIPNRIKLQILVESGWAVANIADLTRRCLPRLTGIIFGIADYAADLALPEIRFDHPVCDWARAAVVNSAGAVGVPAIDAMTVNYPIADPNLSVTDNRQRILNRLKECFNDTLYGIEMGMKGKWVGHPAQLFVVMLAYQAHWSSIAMKTEIEKIKVYQQAVQEKIGATIIDGVMSDRATDRHARVRLRESIAVGVTSVEEGIKLGVLAPSEVAHLSKN